MPAKCATEVDPTSISKQLIAALGEALVQMLRGLEAPAGWTTALPAAVGASLVGALACATGVLEWRFLLPLLLVAPAAWLVPAGTRKPWQNAFLVGLAALVPVVIAITWALLSARSTSPAG